MNPHCPFILCGWGVGAGVGCYRYKGVLAVKGKDEKFVFQGVHMLFDGQFLGKWEEGETRESVFVFIGKDLDKADLKAKFESCKAPDKLRFAVGDRVEANDGQFQPGQVIKLWDDGNPCKEQRMSPFSVPHTPHTVTSVPGIIKKTPKKQKHILACSGSLLLLAWTAVSLVRVRWSVRVSRRLAHGMLAMLARVRPMRLRLAPYTFILILNRRPSQT